MSLSKSMSPSDTQGLIIVICLAGRSQGSGPVRLEVNTCVNLNCPVTRGDLSINPYNNHLGSCHIKGILHTFQEEN